MPLGEMGDAQEVDTINSDLSILTNIALQRIGKLARPGKITRIRETIELTKRSPEDHGKKLIDKLAHSIMEAF